MSSDAGVYGQDRRQRMMRERVQSRWMDAYSPIRHLDPVLVLTALTLAAIGVVMIYSATFRQLTLRNLEPNLFATRQLINLGVAATGMMLVAMVDYRHLRSYSAVFYVGVVVLLALVLTPLGVEVNTSRRWIDLGGFQLQPSELAKLATILAMAAFLHERKGRPGPGSLTVILAIVALPMFLIYLEPDLGTMIVFIWLAFVLLLVGGLRVRWLLALGGAGLASVVAAFRFGLLESYQLNRLIAFLDPGNEQLARTLQYNANQSLIAIGSGQLGGKGLFQGTQTNLSYVPENHTDFIFTVVGEEFGFLGAAFVLGLFAVLIWRGLRIATMAKDRFGSLIAAGATALIVFQVFVNVGMTIGLMPVTGIPLPFVSYGGTSLLVSFLLVGLLLNVHMRRF